VSELVTANDQHLIPERAPLTSATLVWAITAAIAVALVALIVAAPLAQANQHQQFASAIYKTFSFLCHQLPDRSFHLAGHQFAVCSRCTGLYVGFALTTLAYPLIRPLRTTTTPALIWLILATVPLLVDFSLGYFNIWANTHATRFITGALLSSVAVFYIVPGLVEITSRMFHRPDLYQNPER
jgi:uncharacterized membrane protein